MNREYEMLESICAWFVCNAFEQNEDKMKVLSSLFVEFNMLNKLNDILNTDPDFFYERLDVSVFAHDVMNENNLKNPGDVKESMKTLVRQLLKHKLKDETNTD